MKLSGSDGASAAVTAVATRAGAAAAGGAGTATHEQAPPQSTRLDLSALDSSRPPSKAISKSSTQAHTRVQSARGGDQDRRAPAPASINVRAHGLATHVQPVPLEYSDKEELQ